MIKFFLILFLLSSYNIHANEIEIYQKSNFLKECDIDLEDFQKIYSSIKNRDFSLSNIQKISHNGLQNGLFLLGISTKPDIYLKKETQFLIKHFSKEYLLSIPQLRDWIIEALANNLENIRDNINFIGYDNLNYGNKIKILLLLDNFKEKDNELTILLIKDLFNNYALNLDLDLLLTIYHNYLNDEIILQQIRHLLYANDLQNAKKLFKYLKKIESKDRTNFLINFHKLKKKNVKIYKDFIGYDEYSDLLILEHYKKNYSKQYEILSNRKILAFKPEKWFYFQNLLAREILNSDIDEKFRLAYNIINIENPLKRKEYAEQQWLAGFIAFLDKKYEIAIEHFNESLINSENAASKAKNYYWIGISMQKFNNHEAAIEIFKKGSEFPLFFYGQLSADELNLYSKSILIQEMNYMEKISLVKNHEICSDPLFISSYLAYIMGINDLQFGYIKTFFDNTQNKEKIIKGLKILELDTEPYFYREIAKHAMQKNIALKETTFPSLDRKLHPLIQAIIRQESGFKKHAISYKGARGLMQIMPGTAKILSKQLGLKYDHYRLLTDENYNLTLGKYYINQLLQKYDNHKILALAAYNAGPGSVNKWIEKNGDPRDFSEILEIAKWIESIPFSQTRDYIIKILGPEYVYEILE